MRMKKNVSLFLSLFLTLVFVLVPMSPVFASENNNMPEDFEIGLFSSEIVFNIPDINEDDGYYETIFDTPFEKNYFRIWFENDGDSSVRIYLVSLSDPDKTYYSIYVEPNDSGWMEFSEIRRDGYRIEISGKDGDAVKGKLKVRVENTPFPKMKLETGIFRA